MSYKEIGATSSGAGNTGPWLDVMHSDPKSRSEKRSKVTTTVAPTPALDTTDRCDRCGAQAFVRAELAGGGELLFCAHHARAHEDKLREVAVAIHDESDRLSAGPVS